MLWRDPEGRVHDGRGCVGFSELVFLGTTTKANCCFPGLHTLCIRRLVGQPPPEAHDVVFAVGLLRCLCKKENERYAASTVAQAGFAFGSCNMLTVGSLFRSRSYTSSSWVRVGSGVKVGVEGGKGVNGIANSKLANALKSQPANLLYEFWNEWLPAATS